MNNIHTLPISDKAKLITSDDRAGLIFLLLPKNDTKMIPQQSTPRIPAKQKKRIIKISDKLKSKSNKLLTCSLAYGRYLKIVAFFADYILKRLDEKEFVTNMGG